MTRTMAISITLTDEFLSDIIINASETAYGWFAFRIGKRKWRLKDGTDADNDAGVGADAICLSAPLYFDRRDGYEGNMKGRFTLNLNSVLIGLERIISGKTPCGMQGEIAAAAAHQDAGALDSNLCDLIVQAAIFGEIVYG